MNLPPVSIPDLALPFAMPHMVHPFFVHFAIALPVVILLFELVNLLLKRRAVGVSSFLLLVLMVVVYVGAYLAGVTDGKEAAKVLSPEAKEALNVHKQLGIYLVYGSLVVVLFKLISVMVKKIAARLVFLVVLIVFILIAFSEGKKGGELVYRYGANVQAVAHTTAQEAPPASEPKTQKAPVPETTHAQSSESKHETPTPSKAVEEVKPDVQKASGEAKETAGQAVEETHEMTAKAKAAIQDAAEAVKTKVPEATDPIKESVQEVVKPTPKTSVKKITPVETIPAG